jgi:hypothetical protein
MCAAFPRGNHWRACPLASVSGINGLMVTGVPIPNRSSVTKQGLVPEILEDSTLRPGVFDGSEGRNQNGTLTRERLDWPGRILSISFLVIEGRKGRLGRDGETSLLFIESAGAGDSLLRPEAGAASVNRSAQDIVSTPTVSGSLWLSADPPQKRCTDAIQLRSTR